MNTTTTGESQKKSPTKAEMASSPEMRATADAAPEETMRDREERDLRNEENLRDEGNIKEPVRTDNSGNSAREEERLAPLFPQEVAKEYRARWDIVQRSFVDDPKQAVRQGDELVAQVMKSLADTFSKERATLENQLNQADKASTESLRVALRRYRSFFERLLSI